jgi:hypothetical protein
MIPLPSIFCNNIELHYVWKQNCCGCIIFLFAHIPFMVYVSCPSYMQASGRTMKSMIPYWSQQHGGPEKMIISGFWFMYVSNVAVYISVALLVLKLLNIWTQIVQLDEWSGCRTVIAWLHFCYTLCPGVKTQIPMLYDCWVLYTKDNIVFHRF